MKTARFSASGISQSMVRPGPTAAPAWILPALGSPPAVALRTPIDESPEDVRAALAPLRHPFSVAVYNCQNAFSVGAIIRVAHNFLAREIFVIGRAPYYEKASMGMEKYESIVTPPRTRRSSSTG